MLRQVLFFVAACVAAAPSLAHEPSAETPATEPVRVMILGSYHFANPGLDMANIEVDSVLTDQRQREIRILVDTLARWQPTRIAVESVADSQDLTLPSYAESEALLASNPNESVQIGYRMARQLGHDAVFGFDEQPEGDEPGYFPMGPVLELAERSGRMDIIEKMTSEIEARTAREQAALADQSIAESLIIHNDPARLRADHDRFYYGLIAVADAEEQPGAVLNAMWFMRNAKMFAKLTRIAQPGDRVLAVVGSGHAAWLRDLVEGMPGYELVESLPYVRAAAIASRTP